MASNFNAAAAWAEREAKKQSNAFDGATAWAEREKTREADEKAKADAQRLANTSAVTSKMLAGSSLFSNAMQETPVTPSVSDSVSPTASQRLGLAAKSIGNTTLGSLVSLGETAVQAGKNTVEELKDEEYRAVQNDLVSAKQKLRLAEKSKNMGETGKRLYEEALAEVERLEKQIASMQVTTSVGADTFGQQTIQKGLEQKEQALEGTSGAGRWVAENLMGVAQNAALLPLAAINPTLPAVAMGAISAGGKAAELNAQGATPTEALIRGGVSGGIEYLTEKMSIDSLMDLLKVGGKSFAGNLLRQAGTEGLEESASYFMNYVADVAAKDPNAKWSWLELLNNFGSGAFSGGIMGGTASALGGAFANPSTTTTTQEQAAQPSAPVFDNVYTVAVESYLNSGKVNNTAANTIIKNPELSKAFTDLTGTTLEGTTEQKRNIIQQAARDRAFTAQQNETVAEEAANVAEQEYAKAKDEETVRNSGYRSYIRGLFNGGVTIQEAREVFNTPELKSEWETVTGKTLPANETSAIKMIRQTQRDPSKIDVPDIFAEVARPTQSVANDIIETQNDVVEPVIETPPVAPKAEPVVQTPPIAKKPEPVMPPVFNNGKVVNEQKNTVGAQEARFKYKEAPTQTIADNLITNEEREKYNLGNTHKVYSNAESRYDAQERLSNDYEGEKAALENEEWGAAETVMGFQILDDLIEDARETGDWSEVERFKKIYDQKGTTEGQALQARRQFAGTTTELVSEAAVNLESGKAKKLKPSKKAKLLDEVYNQAKDYNKIAVGDTESLINLIKRNNEIRRTTGLFSKKTSKRMDWALHKIAENYPDTAEQFLRDIAVSQIRSISSDYNSVGITEAMKSIRIMNLLSKFSTVTRNLTSNNVFDPIESLANNVGLIADYIMSTATKQHTTAFDKSWASKAKRAGSAEGALKSYVEVGLDAPVSDTTSRYEGASSGRTFKMAGNVVERLFSTWAKYENYALKTTDEFQKGGIKAETQRQIDTLKSKGKLGKNELNDWASETAKQRTFQNDGALSGFLQDINKASNRLHVGSIGAGDMLVTFPKVPGNLVAQGANYSTAGLVNGLREVVKVCIDAKNGNVDTQRQAQAARDFGRGVTGTALFAAFTAFALKGLIDVAGNDDADKESLEKAQGKIGTQWNLSATMRYLNGESAEWEDGDTIMSIGFLDPLNAIMASSSLMADEIKEDGFSIEGAVTSTVGGLWQAIHDLPAMSSFTDLLNSYKYAEGENTGAKIGNALLDYGGSQLSSFVVPNAVRGIATGTDNTVRNQYSSDKFLESTADSIKSGIPGLRSDLPASIDPMGREKTQTGNDALNFLNNNILPGQVTKFKQSELEKEIEAVYDVTQNSSVYPDKSAPSKISYNKEKYELTPEQKQQYQVDAGTIFTDLAQQITATDAYKSASDEEKASMLADANSLARDMAKRNALEGMNVSYKSETWQKAFEALGLGVSAGDYFTYRSVVNHLDTNDSINQVEAGTALLEIDTSDDLKAELWQLQNSQWNADKNPYSGTLYQAGISPTTTIAIMSKYNEIDDMKFTSNATKQKQTLLSKYLDSLALTSKQREAVEKEYKFWQMIPATPIAYSIETMSAAAQKKWSTVSEKMGITEEQYLKYYPIYSNSEKGVTKDMKIDQLVEAGMSRTEAKRFWRLMSESK